MLKLAVAKDEQSLLQCKRSKVKDIFILLDKHKHKADSRVMYVIFHVTASGLLSGNLKKKPRKIHDISISKRERDNRKPRVLTLTFFARRTRYMH